MSLPSWVTQQNVHFNGTLDNAVVVGTGGGLTTLILWDKLSTEDQNTLIALVNKVGGTLPLSGPVAGRQTANFNGAVVGGNATGLGNVSAATAGIATISVGGNKTGSSATGLSNSLGTAGYQNVILVPAVAGSDTTHLNNGSAATSGRQDVSWTGLVAGNATGLANDATAYTATITVDGVAKAISVVGSAAQTFTTLINEINTDLGASAVASIFSTTALRVVSASTGASSTVAIVDGTLFAALTGHGSVQTAVPGVAAVPATTYTATITVDGVAKAISILGSAAQTFTTLLSEINADLGASATATLVNGEVRVTSATVGSTSSVSIVDTTLFAALIGFVEVSPAVNGKGTSRVYSATVIVDGVIKTVSFAGSAAQTYTNLLSQINTDLGSSAVASISGGNLIITSATTGVASSVQISDSGFLFGSLTGYTGISSVNGLGVSTYTATVVCDGVTSNVSIPGASAQTFTTLVSQINSDLSNATVAIVSGNLVFSSNSTTASSTVRVIDGTLFKAVTGFKGFVDKIDGAVDFQGLLNAAPAPIGDHVSLFDYLPHVVVGVKPPVPPFGVTNIPQFTYYGGSPAEWRYLLDDSVVNA